MSASLATSVTRWARLAAWLVTVDFLDELYAGVPFVGAPGIQETFAVSYGQAAGWFLTAGGLLALILEPPVFLLADRWPRRPMVCGALLLCAALAVSAALAPSYWLLLVLIALSAPATGWVCGVAQATLMDTRPQERERLMLRWTLAGALGDLSAPILFSLLALLALGWRSAFVVAAALWLTAAVVIAAQRFPAPEHESYSSDENSHLGLFAAFRQALSERRLWPWLVAVVLCDLLDEILISFGALYLRDEIGLGDQARNLTLGAGMLGCVLGLVVAERLLVRLPPLPVLLASAVLSGLSFIAFLAASSLLPAAVAMFAVGGFSAVHYPLTKAQAYRALPGRSGALNATVTAAGILFLPVPVLLGIVADHVGLFWALAFLGLQPLGLTVIATTQIRRSAVG